ncbi:hypothetical protein HRbin08_01601 [bacterium HR08]|nr:hypothetical protein HRbin08_01601 [bacterium HR08]
MITLLTFLGTNRYETVTYVWHGDGGERSCTTNLFPEAAHAFFAPERVLVCVTAQARGHDNFRALKERLGETLHPMDIPEGKTQAELWEIFDRIAAAVGEDEEVILDVTHAFRSLPLVVFAVASYLRRTKSVAIRHIVYGAYDARDPYRTPPEPTDRVPVFDLTSLLDLLDWLSGAEALLSRSDSALLAEKMERAQNALWRERAGGALPRRLKSVAQKLNDLSHALHLSRPRDVMRLADELLPLLDDARAELERWAKPFAVIAERVRAELEPLAYAEADRLSRENLRRQLELIRHYLKKDLIVQAMTLAREWILSLLVLRRGEGDWLDRSTREEVEKALGAAAARSRGEAVALPEWFASLPDGEKIGQLWNGLTNLRNALAHCAMSRDAPSVQTILTKARNLPDQLRALFDLLV